MRIRQLLRHTVLFRAAVLALALLFLPPLNAFSAAAATDAAPLKKEKASGPSLEIMAGQMIMAGFRGTGEAPLSADLRFLLEDLRKGHVGGIILFDKDATTKESGRNITSPEQVKALVDLLQQASLTPLFIGVDQEGGSVRRLKEEQGFPPFVSAEELGRGPVEGSGEEGKRVGTVLQHVGINTNFAPCLDVNIEPESPAIGALGRAFSADPDVVAAHGLAYARGLFSQGVLPAYKHFPGHGSATDDTHLGLADVTKSWKQDELRPYTIVLPDSPPAMVMIGHIVHKGLSGNLPASLSPYVITNMLRKELGWDGVVITDDLQMQAVEGRYSTKEAIRLSVLAGADILLLGNNLRHDEKEAHKVHALLLELVAEGKISRDRIKDSYKRIMRLKREAGIAP